MATELGEMEWNESGAEPEEDGDLESFLGALPSDEGYVKVYDQDTDRGVLKFKGQHNLMAFMGEGSSPFEDFLHTRYGGGHLFKCDFYTPHGENRRIKKRKTYRVYIDKSDEEERAEREQRIGRPQPQAPMDEGTILRAVQTANAPMIAAMERLVDRLAAQPQQAQQPTDMAGMAALFREFREMMPSAPPPLPPVDPSATFDTVKQMLALAKEIASPESETTPLDFVKGVFDQVAPAIVEAARNNPQLPAPETPQPQAPATAQPQPQTQGRPMDSLRLGAYLMMNAAASGAPVDDFVDVIADALESDDTPTDLVEAFKADPVGELAKLDARASRFQAWIKELFECVTEEIQIRASQKAEEGTDSEPPAPDAAPNAAAGGDGKPTA